MNKSKSNLQSKLCGGLYEVFSNHNTKPNKLTTKSKSNEKINKEVTQSKQTR